jgi:hypothetical protein
MTPPDLGFSPAWLASGVLSPDSLADFVRIAATAPHRSAAAWRWAAVRDFVEERGRLTADECRAVYRLGRDESDAALGTAMMCCVLYQPACPADVLTEAAASDRGAVRRVAHIRLRGRREENK